jgi:hypothetical protein
MVMVLHPFVGLVSVWGKAEIPGVIADHLLAAVPGQQADRVDVDAAPRVAGLGAEPQERGPDHRCRLLLIRASSTCAAENMRTSAAAGITEPFRINDARLRRPADLDNRRHVVGLDQLDSDDVVRGLGDLALGQDG